MLLAASALFSAASAEDRSLSLYNLHTKERATIVYKRDGRFDPDGLAKLNRFLRDWRQNKPIKMDPKLFDILWEVYRKSGATQPINVVCGYRAPETNAMLRRRSSGVAENSLHTKGMAMDYFIPGVPLAKLRALGLQAQAGGVGYYPGSGSPFVHMDTGNVRHWPRMNRSQLVAVFPNGNTLHVPSDGKALPGYSQALAAYKARQARGVLVSWASGGNVGPIPTDVGTGDDASFEIAAADVPLPRLAPERSDGAVAGETDEMAVAIAIAQNDTGLSRSDRGLLNYPPQVDRVITRDRFAAFDDSAFDDTVDAEVDFDSAYSTAAPAVPVELANAMAVRDRTVRPDMSGTSVPIQPTAIVSTVEVGVDLSRTLRADAITAAVFRDTNDAQANPPVLAYAAAAGTVPAGGRDEEAGSLGVATGDVPVPQLNPLRETAAVAPEPARERTPDEVYRDLPEADLTLTKLDSQGFRMWIATPSTREKRYALFTMPDFAQMPTLLDKPEVTFAARFDRAIYRGMRTDHFAGSSTQPPAVVDLTTYEIIAAR
ncbi:MAG: DUF882 domain-containing protein [Bauldia sp.]|nr:DUF882 domain-containing protein [Bauldia sp.]